MNNEIKEILDRIETASEIFDCLLNPEECTELLDYITILQQDTEMYAQLKDEYEEEIKEANDSITWWTNRFKAVERDNRKLKQENEELQQENDDLKNSLENAVADCNLRLQENEKLSDKIEFYEDVDSDRCAYNEELQKENEHLKENNRNMQEEMARVWAENSNLKTALDESQEVIADYKQENERLKEENNNKAMNDYAHAIDESWYRELYDDYKSRCEKAIEYNYELQERYCHSAIFDELVASKIYEITEKELNILQNGSEDND